MTLKFDESNQDLWKALITRLQKKRKVAITPAFLIDCRTRGDGPKTLSFAPNLDKNFVFLSLSCVSGPTKGTDEGKLSTMLVSLIMINHHL